MDDNNSSFNNSTSNNSWQSGIKFVEEKKHKKFIRFLGMLLIIFFAASIGGILGGYYVKQNYSGATGYTKNSSQGDNLSNSAATANVPKNAITKVAELAGPAVVGVDNNAKTFTGSTTLQGSGSGIIFNAEGYIVTNYHVIDGASQVKVTLSGEKPVIAKVVGGDQRADIAVLKIDIKNLPVAKFGDSSKVRVGDTAIAIGNPLGEEFSGSVTVGVISALNRKVTMDGNQYSLLQTDASINPGNSGGALCNEAGEVIGINSLKQLNAEGMGFAIPINEAKPIIEALIKNGYVSRPFVGISYQFIDEENAKQYNMPIGVYIAGVEGGSGAEEAGIKVGDIIVSFDGSDIKDENTVKDILKKHKIGDCVTAKVWRDGKTFDVSIKLIDSKGK